MATRALRLKVLTVDLIAKIEARKADRLAEYEAAIASFDDDERLWPKAAKAAVQEFLRHTDPADWTVDSHYSRRHSEYQPHVEIPIPAKPHKAQKPDTSKMDRDLALLRATTEDTITIAADDNLASYL